MKGVIRSDANVADTADASYPTVHQPYLLLSNIRCTAGPDGALLTDRLWAKDLVEHLVYLDDFTLVAPLGPPPPGSDLVPLPRPRGGCRFQFVALPAAGSRPRAVLQLPAVLRQVWAEVGRADAVHVGVGGWPYPLGWVGSPFARLRGKYLVSVVESADWRAPAGRAGRRSLQARLVGAAYEVIGRACVRAADLALFTQSAYRTEMLGGEWRRGHVIHASWIDPADLRDGSLAIADWSARSADLDRPPRLLFAGRLTPDKGVRVLLDAVRLLVRRGVPVRLDLLGAGELAEECRRAEADIGGGVVRILGTLPYGKPFLEVVAAADLVVVPSLGDEQPRIVYDAFSQAVPVLASDTGGLRDCVRHGGNGLLVPPGDPAALADAIAGLVSDREQLERLGTEALSTARKLTHREMHRRRWVLLDAALGTPRGAATPS